MGNLKTLVFSRRPSEQIVIGGAVVTVLETRRGQCKLAVLADEALPVDRGEVHERKGGTVPQPQRKVR